MDQKIYSITELKSIRDNFYNELIGAEKGIKNSLAFIKNPLPKESPKSREFLVFVVGGTIFKKARVTKKTGQLTIISQVQIPLPLFATENDFFSFLAHQLEPDVNFLVINFAYALKPILRSGRLDGIFASPAKGHQFKGLLGKKIGEKFEKYLSENLHLSIEVSVINDAISLVLAGLSNYDKRQLIGGIVGTGINFSFFLDKRIVVNLESAGFDKFPLTNTGKTVDKTSDNPHHHLFEKEVSGAYLYQHFNLLVGNKPHLSSTQALSFLAQKSMPPYGELALSLLERSAALISCQIAGLYLYKQKKKLFFIIEGNLFWQGHQYKSFVEKYLKKLAPTAKINFVFIRDSGIIGASHLALCDNQKIKMI